MEDQEFYKNIAEICTTLLKAARHVNVDVGLMNDTMIELDKRAKKSGLEYKDLYPDTKK